MSEFGGSWQGGSWQGGSWQGGSWQGGSWGGGSSGTPTFAMRADRPLADFAVAPYTGAAFPDYPGRYWDPDLWALTVLTEFFGPGLLGGYWQPRIILPGPPGMAATLVEINRLLVLAVTERPEAMGEIIQQHQNFQVAWLQLLTIDPGTHPNTFLLMKLVARVGEVVMMHFKRIHHRARPSQICPTLFPPVPVPGHASYPAGHGLIAHLTSIALMEVVPATLHPALLELARIVGFNREIAGLHYESDTAAGVQVANQVLPILNDCPTYQLVKGLAAAEPW
ncbi:PA-phosphatase [Bradyrhizobium sp. 200]|uniref:PA-phosphatase n=1 Tax=Bradyrhizobium sp. 200 TaxID=2782665 RepID=UPI001FFF8F0C|nr:PA-phosphatase [Bradyrhizobium sp. 200]UPJ53614.1 PA-phosphatase [Bradyrhizobium sp. 200]